MSSREIAVLLAEDERDVREMLAAALVRAGCRCDAAEDGETAIRLLTQHAYDLLWLDHSMPRATGTHVLEVARQLGLQTPAVLCSAKATWDDRRHASDLGAVLNVPKPFYLDEVPLILEAAVGYTVTPVQRATRELRVLDRDRRGTHDACVGVLLRLLVADIDLLRCATIAAQIKALANGALPSPIEHTLRTLAALHDPAAPSTLTKLLTLIDELGVDTVDALARAAGTSETEARRALHTGPGVDIRHWVRLRRVRWTLRFMRQGMKVSSAGADAGFPGGGSQITRDFFATIGIPPVRCTRH